MGECNINERCMVRSLIAGALGGLAGAFVMNQVQALWSAAEKKVEEAEEPKDSRQGEEEKQTEQQGEDATVKTAEFISENVFGHDLTEQEKKWAGPAVHYGFGASMGALYGALANGSALASAGRGTAFATALWLGGDEIAVPALGLGGSPLESPLSSHVKALAAHLVYGVVTDLVWRSVAPGDAAD